jgi:hypothetical protein
MFGGESAHVQRDLNQECSLSSGVNRVSPHNGEFSAVFLVNKHCSQNLEFLFCSFCVDIVQSVDNLRSSRLTSPMGESCQGLEGEIQFCRHGEHFVSALWQIRTVDVVLFDGR